MENNEVEVKVGQAMPAEKIRALPSDELISRIPKFTRTDWGGQPKVKASLKKALQLNPAFGAILSKLNAEEQTILGESIVLVAEHQVGSSRKRVESTVEEIRHRLGVTKTTKTEVSESLILI